jgi:probable F420-dependent oxidoreductase
MGSLLAIAGIQSFSPTSLHDRVFIFADELADLGDALKLGAFMGVFEPMRYRDLAIEAEQLGCESVWLPDHLIVPADTAGTPGAPANAGQTADVHPHLPASSPFADCVISLADIAAHTTSIRLGTCVYVAALRHPFVVARTWQSLDLISAGRAILGVGAGWLRSEWTAAQTPFAGRGRRLDETIDICRRLWTEERTSFTGEFFEFDEVEFWPKPVQPGGPPIHVGGSSPAAFDRAARRGDGWAPMDQTPDSITESVARMSELRQAYGRAHLPFEVSVPVMDLGEMDRWRATGAVDRVLVGCRRDADATRSEIVNAAMMLR